MLFAVFYGLLQWTNASEMFECNYLQDGFIPMEKLYDSSIDCIRDGSDETDEAKVIYARHIYPGGKRKK